MTGLVTAHFRHAHLSDDQRARNRTFAFEGVSGSHRVAPCGGSERAIAECERDPGSVDEGSWFTVLADCCRPELAIDETSGVTLVDRGLAVVDGSGAFISARKQDCGEHEHQYEVGLV